MVFGVDDLLAAAIAASTSYIAWSKVDYLMERITKTCKPQLRRRFERARESPTFLLKGFDVSTPANIPHKGRFDHRRSMAFLLGGTQSDMEDNLPLFTPAELDHAFEIVRKNGMWSNGVRLAKACAAIGVEVRPSHIESTLVACITKSEFSEAVGLLQQFGTSMPIAQSILSAIVIGNSNFANLAKDVIAVARTGHKRLEPELLSAAITATAHADWEYAIELYCELRQRWPEYHTRDTLTSLPSTCVADDLRLNWLLEEVRQTCPAGEADVWLRLLETTEGTNAYNKRHSTKASWKTAVDLFDSSPSPANALTCSQVLLGNHYRPSEVPRVAGAVELSDLQWAALGAVIGNSGEALVAATLAREMIIKSQVSPALILKPVANSGMWQVALRLLTLSLTHRRVIPSASEVGLAVRASVALQKWSSAFFWVDRAHSSHTRLPPVTYDIAFEASKHVPYEDTERVVRSMKDIGDTCTEGGILHLLEAAAKHRRTPDMLRLLSNTNAVMWLQ